MINVYVWLILSIHVILLPLAIPYIDNDFFSFECVRLLAITDQWLLKMLNENGCRNDKIEILCFGVHSSWCV